MYCINENNPEFIALAEKSVQPNDVLKAKISIWQRENNTDKFPTLKQIGIEERKDIVQYDLKVINALEKISAIRETIRLNTKDKPYIETNLKKTLQGKGITSQQIDMIFAYMKANNIQEISTEDLVTQLASEYSYTVEINTAKSKNDLGSLLFGVFKRNDYEYSKKTRPITKEVYYTKTKINNAGSTEEITKKEYENAAPDSSYYSNLTVPGGTNYTENEIATPAITPSIKGHAQFATDKGIGWFRSDEQVVGGQNISPDEWEGDDVIIALIGNKIDITD